MSGRKIHYYEFGPFRLDSNRRLLLREGEKVSIPPKVFDLLSILVANHGEILSKSRLMEMLWLDSFVEESNLAENIKKLRKVLGEGPRDNRYIVTVPKEGYRFVASVKELWDGDPELIVRDHSRTNILSGDKAIALAEAAPSNSVLKESVTKEDEAAIIEAAPETIKLPERGGEAVPSYFRKHRLVATLGLVAMFALVFGLFLGLYKFLARRETRAAHLFQHFKQTKLTTNLNVRSAAISPDGKYIVYVNRAMGQQSLLLKKIGAEANISILPPAKIDYIGLTFSPDGNYVYYIASEGNQPAKLYRVPVLGAGEAATMLKEGVGSLVSFSPDGKQMAFIRNDSEKKEDQLIIANADGTGEQLFAARRWPESFSNPPSWSPDGKVFACVVGASDAQGTYQNVLEIRIADRAERVISSHRWQYIGRLLWLSDGSGLLMAARDQDATFKQLWMLSYPEGTARLITDDLNGYTSISLTKDSDRLVAVQGEVISNIWVAPADDLKRLTKITANAGRYLDVTWTPDGKILYATDTNIGVDIWQMETDGSAARQLTHNARQNVKESATADGRYIVFQSNRTGAWQIWRMNRDGGNLKQLTDGSDQSSWPQVSPDGQWVVYQRSIYGKLPTLLRVSIDGGTPVQLTTEQAFNPAISPDGKWIAYWEGDPSEGKSNHLAVIPFAGGDHIMVFDLPNLITYQASTLRWTPDGRALAYVVYQNGTTNIWSQSLDGGKPTQLTDLNEQLFSFTWSGDGKFLCSSGFITNDVILMQDSQ